MDSSGVLTQSDSLSRAEPLVSVIIPVYKVEPYLRECVDSVLAQTYKNLEIILVDDGSPDNCPAICDEYAEKDSRVRVIHKENGGLSDARNAGMKIASADWWTFVDSDDVLHPQMIELLMKVTFENQNCKVVCCSYDVIHENERFVFRTLNQARLLLEKKLLEKYMKTHLWVTTWGKLYFRDLFSGIEFPKGRLHEDEFTTYKLLYNAKIIFYLNQPLYIYRIRSSSIMKSMSYKNACDTYDAIKERLDFFIAKNEKFLVNKTIMSISYFYMCLFSKKFRGIDTQNVKKKVSLLLRNQSLRDFSLKEKLIFRMRYNLPHLYAFLADLKK